MEIKRLSILIPVFNEENTIYEILRRVNNVELIHEIEKEIIVVNDASDDDSENEIFKFKNEFSGVNLKYLKHFTNQGKGKAIQTGLEEATGEYTIIQDADLEYNPEEINLLLEPVISGYADVVYGSRFIGGKPHRVLFFWHSFGNKLLTFLSNMSTNLNQTDMETCFKLIPTRVLQNIELNEKRFGFEPEITIKLSQEERLRFYEVGISYHGRTYKEGKKINWRDGFRAIYCIMKYSNYKIKVSDRIFGLPFWILVILVGVFGIILRLKQYLACRSLWLDEAALGVNIKTRNLAELMEPLDFNQMAPLGFLWLERIAYLAGGTSELAFRFFPLLAGIASVFLAFLLYRKLINQHAALLGMWLMATVWPLIYYSNEVKQYSFDVLAVISLFYIYLKLSKSENLKRLILLGIIGSIWIWFSNVSIIILTSIGIYEGWKILKNKDIKRLKVFLIYSIMWLISFGVYYFLFVRDNPNIYQMKIFWEPHFLPLDFFETLKWLRNHFKEFFKEFLLYGSRYFIFLIFIIFGFILSLFIKSRLVILSIPILITLILSGLDMYPFHSRLILFLIPVFFAFVIVGVDALTSFIRNNGLRIIVAFFIIFFMNKYVHRYMKYFYKDPPQREHVKPVFEKISENMKNNDSIYIYWGTYKTFLFYKERYFDENDNIITGRYDNFEAFKIQFDNLTGRVWVPLSHMSPIEGIQYIENWIKGNPESVIDTYEYSDAYGVTSKVYLIEKKN